MDKPIFYPAVDTVSGKRAVFTTHTGTDAGEQFDTFIEGADRVYSEAPLFYCSHHIMPQHQVFYVGGGNQHTLVPVKPAGFHRAG